MKISQEVRDFAHLNPSPLEGEGDSAKLSGVRGSHAHSHAGGMASTTLVDPMPTLEEAEAGMAMMSEKYRDGGFVRGGRAKRLVSGDWCIFRPVA